MKVSRAGLKKPLKEGDYDGLVEVMGYLMKVKERQAATDGMFEPLKQTIELLRTYGEELPEEAHLKLQVGSPSPHPRADSPQSAGGGSHIPVQRGGSWRSGHWGNLQGPRGPV